MHSLVDGHLSCSSSFASMHDAARNIQVEVLFALVLVNICLHLPGRHPGAGLLRCVGLYITMLRSCQIDPVAHHFADGLVLPKPAHLTAQTRALFTTGAPLQVAHSAARRTPYHAAASSSFLSRYHMQPNQHCELFLSANYNVP